MHLPARALVRVATCAALLFTLLAAPLRAAQSVDFAKLADTYLAAHPVPGEDSALSMEKLVEAHFTPARVGAIDLRFPRAYLKDKAAMASFKEVVTAILQVHGAWFDVVGASGAATDAARADVLELIKWLKTAKPAPEPEKAADFFEVFVGGAEQAARVARVADGFRSGAALGLEPRGGKLQMLVVSPERRDFLELAGVFGKLEPEARGVHWNDQLLGWTEFGWNTIQVVALQYPPLKPDADKLKDGMSMNEREPTGLAQHVAQRCAVQLCWHTCDKLLDPALEIALAQALVVDLYKGNNTRSGGASRGNSVDGITAFVPGGNPNGGALPPNNADSSWRATLGADYFLKPLRAAQKAGAKLADDRSDKHTYFQIVSDDTAKRLAMRAPFFGLAARDKEVPAPEFLRDYQEFFRAYKTAFAHWLRDERGKGTKEARERFSALVKQVVEAGSAATFEEVVQEIYGLPLSSKDAAAKTLEREFCEWLSSAG
jgi:hypothetical protein